MFKLLKLQSDDTEEISVISDNITIDTSRLPEENTSTHNVSKNESTSHTNKDDVGGMMD